MRIQNRSPFKPRAKGGYKIENKADEATVYIYDEIGWFGVDAGQFVKDLNDLSAKTVHIRFNSPGGTVFDGTAMFNAIRQLKAKTISHIDGLAASIASVIALGSDEVRMSENAFMMIHEPWSMVVGNSDIMREEADLLDKVGGVIAKTYIDKTGKSAEEIEAMMSTETWLQAEEALEMGFIDFIDGEKDEKAKINVFDLSVFANVPDKLLGVKKDLNERDIEQALRVAGCSKNEAKGVLAKGFAAIQDGREAQTDGDGDDGREAQSQETPLREVEPEVEDRTVKLLKPEKDRVSDLLTRAEVAAPTPD